MRYIYLLLLVIIVSGCSFSLVMLSKSHGNTITDTQEDSAKFDSIRVLGRDTNTDRSKTKVETTQDTTRVVVDTTVVVQDSLKIKENLK